MKGRRLALWLTLLALFLGRFESQAQDDEEDPESSHKEGSDHGDAEAEVLNDVDVDDDDAVLQVNPDYVDPPNRSLQGPRDEEEEDGDDDDDEDEEARKRKTKRRRRSKRAIKSALASSKRPSRSAALRRRTAAMLRKHGLTITAALALYAFRKELRLLLWRMCTRPVQDPETGEWFRQPVPVSVTAILKIIIFIDVMRRVQQSSSSPDGSDGGGQRASPLAALLLAGGAGRNNPFMAMLLSKLLESPNSAYVPPVEQHYTFERINNRYNRDADALRKVLAPSRTTHSLGSGSTASYRSTASAMRRPSLFNFGDLHRASSVTYQRNFAETIVVLDWTNLDTSVSQLTTLRDQVSFLLSQYRDESWSDAVVVTSTPAAPPTAASGNHTGGEALSNATTSNTTTASSSAPVVSVSMAPAALRNVSVEVVVVLESPGGSAGDYALAAQQILRLRRSGMKVTICVDKVAASGGYMIASCASPGCLLAAPFAIVGSIGVIGQSLNVHKALKGWGVEPLVFRGGRDKAPVGLIGEVTREGMQKVQAIVDNTHLAFKKHVAEARPVLADRIEELATGDIWLGYDAVDLGLVDRLVTSDEYLEERLVGGARVLKLTKLVKPRYPFGRPTTTTQEMQCREGPLSSVSHRIAQAVAGECQQFLHRLSDLVLDTVAASDDPAAIARAVRATTSSSVSASSAAAAMGSHCSPTVR
jgi:signal peptide peptidase SppA